MSFSDHVMDWVETHWLHLESAAMFDVRFVAFIAVILVVLGAIPRRWLTFFGASLLAGVALVVAAAPQNATDAIVIAAVLGSLLITFVGLNSRRQQRRLEKEFQNLTDAIQQLRTASDRRFLQSLNSRTQGDSATVDASAVDPELGSGLNQKATH
jgi:hypothetical protein